MNGTFYDKLNRVWDTQKKAFKPKTDKYYTCAQKHKQPRKTKKNWIIWND